MADEGEKQAVQRNVVFSPTHHQNTVIHSLPTLTLTFQFNFISRTHANQQIRSAPFVFQVSAEPVAAAVNSLCPVSPNLCFGSHCCRLQNNGRLVDLLTNYLHYCRFPSKIVLSVLPTAGGYADPSQRKELLWSSTAKRGDCMCQSVARAS